MCYQIVSVEYSNYIGVQLQHNTYINTGEFYDIVTGTRILTFIYHDSKPSVLCSKYAHISYTDQRAKQVYRNNLYMDSADELCLTVFMSLRFHSWLIASIYKFYSFMLSEFYQKKTMKKCQPHSLNGK